MRYFVDSIFMQPCPACAALFSSRTRRLHTDRGNVFSGGSLLRRFQGCKSYRRYVPLRHGLWRYGIRCSSYRHDGPSVRECCSRRRTILHRRTGISKYRQWCCPIFEMCIRDRPLTMVIQDNTIPRLSFADGCGICFAVCYKKGSGTKSRR